MVAKVSHRQEVISKLTDKIYAAQERLDAIKNITAVQHRATVQLDIASHRLDAAQTEFATLEKMLVLLGLVTDQNNRSSAVTIIENHKFAMSGRMRRWAKLIERMLPNASDKEANGLLLEARDLLKASVDFVGTIKVSLPKQ